MEEEYGVLGFLDDYDDVKFIPLAEALAKHGPELLIILDGNNLARCSRDPQPALKLINEAKTAIAVIDHHEPTDVEPGALYINHKSPAVTQDVYEICFNQLNLKKPAGYAQTAMVGLYSDTGGFTYDNPRYKDTFRMASELIEDGASTELAASQLTQYSYEGLEVLTELLKNVAQTKDCTYTYISDEFYQRWTADGRLAESIHEGFDIFLHNFMRNIEGRFWGFAIYPDPNAIDKTYSVSFRSLQGKVDVSRFARQLGGGGHKAAAGAKIKASSVDEALQQVESVISA